MSSDLSKIIAFFGIFMDYVHIIEHAERLIESKGIDRSKLARELGLGSRYVADIKSGKSKKPSSDFALALINKLNFNPVWLQTGEGEMLLASLPVKPGQEREGSKADNEAVDADATSKAEEEHWRQVQKTTKGRPVPLYTQDDFADGSGYEVPVLNQKLSAGNGAELPDNDVADAFVRVPAQLKRYGKNLAALAVEGDSMYPTLDRGDLVVCDSCGWSGEGIYALRMNGEGYVKRVTHDPGKILLISDNPKYPIREYQENIEGLEIVGRIHCAIKNLE
jgi:phage repressor protein C with HTH and peptisase S24 domain